MMVWISVTGMLVVLVVVTGSRVPEEPLVEVHVAE